MKLREAFSLPVNGKCISIVGAGGKTSLIFKMANEFSEDGLKCVVMTTTHIYQPTLMQAITVTDCHADSKKALTVALRGKSPVAIGSLEESTGKLCLPSDNLLAFAWNQADWILVEADGSRHFPIKVPASHEPKIFEPSDSVIAVAGLSALGKPLNQVCQRSNLASVLLDVPIDSLVTPFMLARMLTSDQGLYKNVKSPSRFSIFLNQADNESLCMMARETSSHIKSILPDCTVVAGSLRDGVIFIC